jgi:hypothetical protein
MTMHERSEATPSSDDTALDFWLGDWSCTWDGGGGRNRITKELDGHVVVERFESHAPERWSGMSLSVYDRRAGWRQTWVDSTGNYWAFDGEPEGAGIVFRTVDLEDEREIARRMVFSGIEADTFEWRWERSLDAGETWETIWSIHYVRAGTPRTSS